MNPELLAELRDIHEPLPPAFWPPAPGWWILFALIMGAIALGLWLAWRRRRAIERARLPYQIAVQDMAAAFDAFSAGQSDALAFADSANAVLKRLIAQHEQRASTTTHGREWIHEIVERFACPDLFPLLDSVLGSDRYRPGYDADIEEVYARLSEVIQRQQALARP